MKNKQYQPDKTTDPKAITKKEEVTENPDEHIDQDFPGFPHQPANKKTIRPETKEDKANANLISKNTQDAKSYSVGSANAFEGTENEEVLRAELDKDKEQDDKTNNY